MVQIPNKTAAEIVDIDEKTWFTRYPIPQKNVFDRGTKFMAEFSKMFQDDYGLKRKPIRTRNNQSSAIIKQIHQKLEISSANLTFPTSLTTIHGLEF